MIWRDINPLNKNPNHDGCPTFSAEVLKRILLSRKPGDTAFLTEKATPTENLITRLFEHNYSDILECCSNEMLLLPFSQAPHYLLEKLCLQNNLTLAQQCLALPQCSENLLLTKDSFHENQCFLFSILAEERTIHLLLNSKQCTSRILKETNGHGNTLIIEAYLQGRKHIFKQLLNHKNCSAEVLQIKNASNKTLLQLVCEAEDLETLALIIRSKNTSPDWILKTQINKTSFWEWLNLTPNAHIILNLLLAQQTYPHHLFLDNHFQGFSLYQWAIANQEIDILNLFIQSKYCTYEVAEIIYARMPQCLPALLYSPVCPKALLKDFSNGLLTHLYQAKLWMRALSFSFAKQALEASTHSDSEKFIQLFLTCSQNLSISELLNYRDSLSESSIQQLIMLHIEEASPLIEIDSKSDTSSEKDTPLTTNRRNLSEHTALSLWRILITKLDSPSKNKENQKKLLMQCNRTGDTLIMWAYLNKDQALFKYLIQLEGCTSDILSLPNLNQENLIQRACKNKDISSIRFIIDSRAPSDIDFLLTQVNETQNLLQWIFSEKHIPLIQALTTEMLKIQSFAYGTIIHELCFNENQELLTTTLNLAHCTEEVLLEKNRFGETPLMLCCKQKSYKILQVLLNSSKCTTDVFNAQDNHGNTALLISYLNNLHSSMFHYLVHAKQFNPKVLDITNKQGVKLIPLICYEGDTDTLLHLFRLLADRHLNSPQLQRMRQNYPFLLEWSLAMDFRMRLPK